MNGTLKSGKNTQTIPDGTQKNKKLITDDIFYHLKYVAYCRSQLSSGSAGVPMAQFVEFAKYQICKQKNILFKDPKWDNYLDVEILVEYFTMRFDSDEAFRKEFEQAIPGGNYEQIIDWFDAQIETNQKELKTAKSAENEFEFEPEQIMGND